MKVTVHATKKTTRTVDVELPLYRAMDLDSEHHPSTEVLYRIDEVEIASGGQETWTKATTRKVLRQVTITTRQGDWDGRNREFEIGVTVPYVLDTDEDFINGTGHDYRKSSPEAFEKALADARKMLDEVRESVTPEPTHRPHSDLG